MGNQGDGWTTSHLDELGEGHGFRKIRKALGVDAFGVNAIVMPPNFASGFHYHDEQQELYFVHRGTMEIEFLDGTKLKGPGPNSSICSRRSQTDSTSMAAPGMISAPLAKRARLVAPQCE